MAETRRRCRYRQTQMQAQERQNQMQAQEWPRAAVVAPLVVQELLVVQEPSASMYTVRRQPGYSQYPGGSVTRDGVCGAAASHSTLPP